MILTKNHSTLNTTKADTYRFKAPSAVLKDSINKISSKFSTSDAYYMLHGINLAIENKKCRLKWIIKDEEYNRSQEVLQKYCQLNICEEQLPELTEYYKYYTQTSILYQANFFKLMHQYRERRKVLEYNRLKILLNLSETQNTSQIQQKNKKHVTINSFYILSKLSVTNQAQQSEIMIAKLSSKLEKTLGPNCFRTIEELDRNYHFQKKKVDVVPFEIHSLKKSHLPTQDKENFNQTLKSSKVKHSKRNSCQIQQGILSKKADSKQKSLNKKKHYSMDNVSTLLKDYQIRENKPKLYGNWMKNSQPTKQQKGQGRTQKGQTIKFRQRLSQQKFKSEQTEKDCDIRSKIIDTKEKIKKEKLQLKKKTTLTTNQSQIMMKTTKKATPIHLSPGQRHPNRKLLKIAFC